MYPGKVEDALEYVKDWDPVVKAGASLRLSRFASVLTLLFNSHGDYAGGRTGRLEARFPRPASSLGI